MEKWLILGCGKESKNGPIISYARKQGNSQRGQRNQPEGAPSGQSWGNVNIKIKNDSNGTTH